MNIKHSCGLNLSADSIPPRLHMVQGDANSRTIVATLWDGAQLYSIPAGAAVMVRFRKPDGTGGLYDATESGSKVSYAGSVVTAPVATQMLAVAGDVFAEIDIFGSSSGAAAERLATFRFVVEVAPCVLPDAEIISSDYYNILASDIADAKAAADLAKDYAAAAKQSADSAAVSVEGAVKYNTAQALTDAQKQQARENIGAPAPYNPNLLDNWYFGNPVNQRGGHIVPAGTPYFVPGSSTQSGVLSSPATVIGYLNAGGLYPQVKVGSETYITPIGTDVLGYAGPGYGIDRWVSGGGSLELLSGNIVCIATGVGQVYRQPISPDLRRALAGEIVTLSILCSEISGGWMLTDISGFADVHADVGINSKLTSWTFTVAPGEETGQLGWWAATAGDRIAIRAIKLELGSQQTLAHQENGVWVLNELPDYGEQLRRCQRYYFKTASAQYSAYLMRKVDNDYLMDSCIFPVEMRTTPSVQLLSYRIPTTGAVITPEGSASQITPNGFCIAQDAGKFADSSVFQVAFSASADL